MIMGFSAAVLSVVSVAVPALSVSGTLMHNTRSLKQVLRRFNACDSCCY
jgi:hypothetical protein